MIKTNGKDVPSKKVEPVMTRQVVTCFAEDDFQKALDAMAKQPLRRIPIMDNKNKIAGIIARQMRRGG